MSKGFHQSSGEVNENAGIDELVAASRVNLQAQLLQLANSLDMDQSATLQGQSRSKEKSANEYTMEKNGTHRQSLNKIAKFMPAEQSDFNMPITAADGALELQKGKDSLMKHINHPNLSAGESKIISPSSPAVSTSSAGNKVNNEQLTETEGFHPSEEDSDDEYVVPGDDGRGLLTDVPLILGPTEIEVLPMIIMSGIYHSETSTPTSRTFTPEESKAVVNMHAVRCHLLLAQDNGRNLLRELLIFVAAWDLHEDELYFKFMVKIMDAILENGLMSFTYHTFREYDPLTV